VPVLVSLGGGELLVSASASLEDGCSGNLSPPFGGGCCWRCCLRVSSLPTFPSSCPTTYSLPPSGNSSDRLPRLFEAFN
jgi:hypothetical protein